MKEIEILFELVTLARNYNEDVKDSELYSKNYHRLRGFISGVEILGYKIILELEKTSLFPKIKSVTVVNLETNAKVDTEIRT